MDNAGRILIRFHVKDEFWKEIERKRLFWAAQNGKKGHDASLASYARQAFELGHAVMVVSPEDVTAKFCMKFASSPVVIGAAAALSAQAQKNAITCDTEL